MRLRDTAALVRQLHQDGDLNTSMTGALLIALGAAEHVAPHPDCDMQKGYGESDPDTWKDATGRIVWDLRRDLRDCHGDLWQYAGGFHADPDTQPILSRKDWSECDIPLCRVWAAVGPLEVAP